MNLAIDRVVDRVTGAGIARRDETGITHPRFVLAASESLPHGTANQLGKRNPESLRLSLRSFVLLLIEADLRADHIPTLWSDDNTRAARVADLKTEIHVVRVP